MNAVTEQQRRLLDILKAYSAANGRMPSFDEMRQAMGLASKSGIHRLIAGLEERGFLRRIPNRARAIEIIEDPHLPETAPINTISLLDFAREARRRGLVVGTVHRETYSVGDKRRERRLFLELRG